MKLLPIGLALAVLLPAGLPGQDLPPGDLLARVKEHERATFEHIPDYACLETIGRFRKSSIRPFDTLHLEVAVVGGKELFARKGATQFQGDDPTAFVTAGMIGLRRLFRHSAQPLRARRRVDHRALGGGAVRPKAAPVRV